MVSIFGYSTDRPDETRRSLGFKLGDWGGFGSAEQDARGERARRIEMIDISMMEREGASRGECGRRIEFVRSADCVTHCTAV